MIDIYKKDFHMALAQVSTHLLTSPDNIKALHQAFYHVELLETSNPNPTYRTFRIKGGGVPNSDKYVVLRLETTIQGGVRVAGWDYDQSPLQI